MFVRYVAGFALAFCMFFGPLAHGAVLQTDSSGSLVGAQGVLIGTDLYDVVFTNGSCELLYDGCLDEDLVFGDSVSAQQAGQALLDQVYIGIYDTTPAFVEGCSTTQCFTMIPYNRHSDSTLIDVAFVENNFGSNSDDILLSQSLSSFDTTPYGNRNYAVFTEAAAIPLPGGLWLYASALLGLRIVRQK